jgi:ADP-ribose pyrophosphatase YjhB (NUDIX family)
VTAVRFCSTCGAPLPAPPPIRCADCGTDHWRNAKPCANGIVVRGREILLVRRAHAPWHRAWCAPGGFCEDDEHPIAAAQREILEEAGVRARVTGFLGIWIDRYADDPTDVDAEMISVAYYLAEALEGGDAAFDRSETEAVGWFELDDLPAPLAPPRTLDAIIDAAAPRIRAGELATPLPDAPRPA